MFQNRFPSAPLPSQVGAATLAPPHWYPLSGSMKAGGQGEEHKPRDFEQLGNPVGKRMVGWLRVNEKTCPSLPLCPCFVPEKNLRLMQSTWHTVSAHSPKTHLGVAPWWPALRPLAPWLRQRPHPTSLLRLVCFRESGSRSSGGEGRGHVGPGSCPWDNLSEIQDGR